MPTKIEWCQETWNPVTGCSPISEGCENCYARRMANRLRGRFGYPEAPNHFDITFHKDRLEQPRKWVRPRRVFVCSMSDLFHESMTQIKLFSIFHIIEKCPQHIFLVLTKRPERMHRWFCKYYGKKMSNIWLGVTAENQKCFNERCFFLDIPASKHFVSFEPLLEAIEIESYPCPQCNSLNPQIVWPCPYCNGRRFKWPDWVVAGPETGPGARECKPEWIELLYEQCYEAGIPFFDKRKKNWIAREFPNG